MLRFDELSSTVNWQDTHLELQPLSFKLLELLWSNANQIVSNQTIYETLWHKTNVSPETLKQRIFLLRKALTEAGLDGIEIKSIRGEGYRLITTFEIPAEPVKPNTETKYNNNRFLVAALCAIVIGIVFWFFIQPAPVPNNNRVVVWSNQALSSEADSLAKFKQILKTTIFSQKFSGKLQFIESQFSPQQTISTQARKSRAGLIILLEYISESGIRAQLIEPHTATVLFAKSIELQEQQEMQLAETIIAAAERLFSSNKLILTKAMRNDSSHPIWAELSAIAHGEPL